MNFLVLRRGGLKGFECVGYMRGVNDLFVRWEILLDGIGALRF